MQSVMIVVLGLAGMTFGWFVYSKFIATKIYQLDPDFVTPAHEFNDGVDFHPTHKFILWGHHFTSVAGAAPIVGSGDCRLLGLGAGGSLGDDRHSILCRRT